MRYFRNKTMEWEMPKDGSRGRCRSRDSKSPWVTSRCDISDFLGENGEPEEEEFFPDAEVKSDDQGDLAKALYHANFTVKTLERFLKNRGNGCSSRGITKWELELLRSAYDALSTPLEDRKFGLNKP